MTDKSRVALTVMSLMIAVVLPSMASEPVNVSRHVYDISAGSLQTIVPISNTTLDSFCRDADGCSVSLRVELGNLMRGFEWRVYLAATDSPWTHWSSTIGSDVNFDDDDNLDFAGQVSAGLATCSMSDADELVTTLDTAPGFSLTLTNTAPLTTATCKLVIFD